MRANNVLASAQYISPKKGHIVLGSFGAIPYIFQGLGAREFIPCAGVRGSTF